MNQGIATNRGAAAGRGRGPRCWPMALALLGAVGILAGCSRSSDPQAPVPATTPAANTTAPGGAAGESRSPPVALDQQSPEGLLLHMMAQYRDAVSYADAGTLHVEYTLDGENVAYEFPFSVTFQRPNKLRLHAYEGTIVCDGEQTYGTYEDIRGYVVSRPAPLELTPPDVYFDDYLRVMLTEREGGAVLPLTLLLSKDFSSELLQQGRDRLQRLPQQTIDGEPCHGVQLTMDEGRMTFWIGASSSVLRRVEYPTAGLVQFLQRDGKQAGDARVVAHFAGARLNDSIAPEAFRFELPPGAKLVKRFVGPSLPPILGRKGLEFEFTALDGAKITPQSLAGKVVVLDFWATWCGPCLQNMPNLARVHQRYKDHPRVQIVAVNIEGPDVSDDAVRQKLAEIDVVLPVARDPQQHAFKTFGTAAIPTVVLLGPDGTVQRQQVGLDPSVDPVEHLVGHIEALLAGKDLYPQQIADFERLMMEEPAAAAPPPPQATIAPRRDPQHVELRPLWTCRDVQEPGNIVLVPQPQGPPRILVHESWRGLAELDADGRVVARPDLKLPETAPIAFTRTAVDKQGRRYYALGAAGVQQVFVYDENWRRLCAYPEAGEHPGIADCLLADLDGDGSVELAVSYYGVVGVQVASLQGERLFANRSLRDVPSLAVTEPNEQGQRLLLACNSEGTLATLSPQLHRGSNIVVPDQFLRLIVSGDVSGDSRLEYIGIGFSPQGSDVLVGIDAEGDRHWTLDLPAGPQHPALQQIAVAHLAGPQRHWVVAGVDGSLHFVSADGQRLDVFQTGALINGFAAAAWDSRRLLLVASPEGVQAWEVVPRQPSQP
jgi:thiol-disulfide isomerase/thioredoxin